MCTVYSFIHLLCLSSVASTGKTIAKETLYVCLTQFMGFPCGSASKESAHNAGRTGFDPWVGKIPWRRERLPTLVFWPGEFHGLYTPWSHRVRHNCATLTSLHFPSSQVTRKNICHIFSFLKNSTLNFIFPVIF